MLDAAGHVRLVDFGLCKQQVATVSTVTTVATVTSVATVATVTCVTTVNIARL
jgi:hypothetical protein